MQTNITQASGVADWVLSSFANNVSILLKPFCSLLNIMADGVNFSLKAITSTDIGENIRNVPTEEQANLFEKMAGWYYNQLLSPEAIFVGDNIALVNVNVFEENTESIQNNEIFTLGNKGLVGTIKGAVQDLYLLIRNACAIVMLSALIYIGIRIILSSNNAQEQSKWKERIMDWLKGLVLLVFMHIFLIASIELVNNISKVLANMLTSTISLDFYEGLVDSENVKFTMVGAIRHLITEKTLSLDGTGYVVLTILYCYITYMTIVFLIAYIKRFMYMMVMIIIAPIFGTWYAFGKMGKQRFERFFKEFISGLMVQPFHIIIYYILVAIPLRAMTGMGTINSVLGIGTIFTYIYVLIAISMIRPIEKFVRTLFGFSGTMLDNVASFESGKQSLDAGVNAVKKTAAAALKVGTMVAKAAATGGASLAGDLTQGLGVGGEGGDPTSLIPRYGWKPTRTIWRRGSR